MMILCRHASQARLDGTISGNSARNGNSSVRIEAADGCYPETLQKEASQHDQQIRCWLQRSQLQRTADVCGDHIADSLPSSSLVKQIAGIKGIMPGSWGRPQQHFMRAKAGESGALRHSELFGIHDGSLLSGDGLNTNFRSIPFGAPPGILAFLARDQGGEVAKLGAT